MKKGRITVGFIIVLAGLFFCAALSLAAGARFVPLGDVVSALTDKSMESFDAVVVRERIPRTIFGILIGCSLGISGTLMQSITRNPIADPSVLGVNSGAAFFVVCGIAFFGVSSAYEFIFFAMAGAAVSALLVYGIGSIGYGGATPLKLVLAGSASATALSSLTSIVMMPRDRVMDTFRFWQIGSVSGATYEKIWAFAPFFGIGAVVSIILSPQLNILALGDEAAAGLGAKHAKIRLIGAISGVLLCGASTAVAGPIGFVGLMVPHVLRLIFGNDMRVLIPMSALGGAVLLTLSDVAGRIIGSPGETEVGIVTAVIGGPAFVIIAMKAKVKAI
ncbi:iron ABC transporter permease [Ruminococcus sp. HUN007]|uniref:FecCD family ABC transporter permease n=1 Tax=Ruminococcus sp. HUN007 TaxID=1514668 RepID=UPI0005D14069|nr:iron ABC transporter permease [Ruminococcus sp. HUN007]